MRLDCIQISKDLCSTNSAQNFGTFYGEFRKNSKNNHSTTVNYIMALEYSSLKSVILAMKIPGLSRMSKSKKIMNKKHDSKRLKDHASLAESQFPRYHSDTLVHTVSQRIYSLWMCSIFDRNWLKLFLQRSHEIKFEVLTHQ